MDRGFGRAVKWDVPLLTGYEHTFVENSSSDPGTHHFGGISSNSIVREIRDWSPAAIIVYGWRYRSHLSVMRRFSGVVPVLFRGDSTLLGAGSIARRTVRSLMLRWVYSHVDAALYVGSRNRDYFKAHGLKDPQLFWAPHAIDNHGFGDSEGSSSKDARAWRKQLGIDASDVTWLYAGKLEHNKGVDLLIHAFLERQAPNEHLIIAGSGGLEIPLRQLAGANQRVHFIGFQNQSRMPTVYRLGDVFVMPSRGPVETWGLAVNEAMASSRPVIVSDCVGCAADLVHEGVTGMTFARGDRGALAEAMAVFVQSKERRVAMGHAAAELISSWSIEEQAARVEQAIETVLEQHAGKRSRGQ